MVKKGRKPITPSPQPDPKVWKWCKHPECQEVIKERGLLDAEDQQEKMRKNSRYCAVFSEDYCWKHLPEETKAAYKTKIERWVKAGHSLAEANLQEANLQEAHLQGAYLWKANLQKAELNVANLQKAFLVGANLSNADLQKAELQETYLIGAKLQNASLRYANLQGAYLSYANLQKAELNVANLQKAFLVGAKLQNASLRYANLQGAYLSYANLQEADLIGAKLQKADLTEANFQNAHLSWAKLNGAFLYGVELGGAKRLTWTQLRRLENGKWVGKARIGEEKGENWAGASDAYRLLKNYFHQQGRYDDESKAYYREKLMAKHEAHEELFGKSTRVGFKEAIKSEAGFYSWLIEGFEKTFQNIGKFFVHNENKGIRRHWLGLWLLWAVAGFGERWMRTVAWAVGTFAFFGLLHWLGTNAGWWTLMSESREPVKHLINCLYFSLVTFVTLGFGDIWPALTAWPAKILVGVEVVMGYVFLGMIVVLIARKFGR